MDKKLGMKYIKEFLKENSIPMKRDLIILIKDNKCYNRN